MKPTELMICDLVCCINGSRHYPQAPKGRINISGFGSGNPCKILRLEHVAIVEYDGEKISEYGSLAPIPLTEEMLKANGFVKGNMGIMWHDSEFYVTKLESCYIPFRLEKMHIQSE